jgi:hypothetical protein
MTTVSTSAIRIQRPVERHALYRIQGRAAGDLLISRLVGAALGLVERFGPVLTNLQRYRLGGRRFTAEIEEGVGGRRHGFRF